MAKRLRVDTYLQEWLHDYAVLHVSANTLERYEQIVRLHLIPGLGSILLSRLTSKQIRAYYARAMRSGRHDGNGGLSPTTVLQHHRVLREALRHAVDDGLIRVNPADRVPAPRKRHRVMTALDEHETGLLLAAAAKTSLYVPVLLAVTTGMRRGEILALQWADIDWDQARIMVQRTLETTRAGLRFKPPKTRRARRAIAMPKILLRELSRLHSRQRRAAGDSKPGLVCPAKNGKTWKPNSLSPAFRKLVVRAGVTPIRFHDLRHTHATQLLRQGIHPKVVSERLGHSSIGLTLDTYSHVLPDMQRQAAASVDALLAGSWKE